jgi:hypothetical protein
MRSPLIVTSIGFHLVVVAGFFVAGLWKLERLDDERRPVDIALSPPPPPAPSGSPAAAPAEAFKKKPRTVTKALVQPTVIDPETRPASTSSTRDATGTGGTGSGAGSGSGTDPIGTGTCTEPPCGNGELPAEKKDPPKAEAVIVPPTVIKGLRTSGETQIHPPATVKTAILRDGRSKVVATFRLCVGIGGEVASTAVLKSSGYAGYDAAIDAGLRGWRYRAYEIGGRKVPVCGAVTFIYTMQ